MATFNKFNQFAEDLLKAVHNFSSHAIKVYLSNTTPSASTHETKSALAEISTGNGYTGPQSVTVSVSETGGTAQVDVSTDTVVITATGSVGPFRYVVCYNDGTTAVTDPLIGWWDYGGSGVTLANGETFTIDLAATLLTIT